MPIGPRTIKCDIAGCDQQTTEDQFGTGFPGWIIIQGVEMNGSLNPAICPGHIPVVMDFVDNIKGPPK